MILHHTLRNHRRDHRRHHAIRTWWRHWGGLAILLAACVTVGLLIGHLRNLRGGLQGPLLLEEPTTITLDQAPRVVSCFKYWTETPGGNALLMVWSDGQVWSAPTDNPTTLAEWTLFSHVRLGETQ